MQVDPTRQQAVSDDVAVMPQRLGLAQGSSERRKTDNDHTRWSWQLARSSGSTGYCHHVGLRKVN